MKRKVFFSWASEDVEAVGVKRRNSNKKAGEEVAAVERERGILFSLAALKFNPEPEAARRRRRAPSYPRDQPPSVVVRAGSSEQLGPSREKRGLFVFSLVSPSFSLSLPLSSLARSRRDRRFRQVQCRL